MNVRWTWPTSVTWNDAGTWSPPGSSIRNGEPAWACSRARSSLTFIINTSQRNISIIVEMLHHGVAVCQERIAGDHPPHTNGCVSVALTNPRFSTIGADVGRASMHAYS